MNKLKECPHDRIMNPKTGRCVLKTGAIGKKLVEASKPKPVKRSTASKNREVLDLVAKKASINTKLQLKKVNKHLKETLKDVTKPMLGRKNATFLLDYLYKTFNETRIELKLSVYNDAKTESINLIVRKEEHYNINKPEYKIVFIRQRPGEVDDVVGVFNYDTFKELKNMKLSKIIKKSKLTFVNNIFKNMNHVGDIYGQASNLKDWKNYITEHK